MTKYKIQDWMTYYENFKVKVKGNWYFVSQDMMDKIIKGATIKGEMVKKRTRIWIE